MPKHPTPLPRVDAAVPEELWLAVFCGAVDETIAIERSRRAASAASEIERRAILFNDEAVED